MNSWALMCICIYIVQSCYNKQTLPLRFKPQAIHSSGLGGRTVLKEQRTPIGFPGASRVNLWPTFEPTCVLITGWWLGHPSEKYARQLGWLFPIYGKIKLMFQTTTLYHALTRGQRWVWRCPASAGLTNRCDWNKWELLIAHGNW